MRAVLFVILTVSLISSGINLVQAEDSLEPDHVLLINSYNQRMSWVQNIVTGVEDVLAPDKNNIVLHIDNMDSKQFYSQKYFKSYRNYIANKYTNQDQVLNLQSVCLSLKKSLPVKKKLRSRTNYHILKNIFFLWRMNRQF